MQEQSLLGWMIQALGLYALILPFAGFVIFVGACLVVALGKRPAVYLPLLPAPLLIGIFGSVHGSPKVL